MFMQTFGRRPQASTPSTGFALRSSGSARPRSWSDPGRFVRGEQNAAAEGLEEQYAEAPSLGRVRRGFVPTTLPPSGPGNTPPLPGNGSLGNRILRQDLAKQPVSILGSQGLPPIVQAQLNIGRNAGSGKDQSLREPPAEAMRAAAAEGIRTPATTLPYLDRIQASFGRHSLGHVKAHVGPEAAKAAREINAAAFASGDHVVFGRAPDLRTAAHEAAHVVQQQAGVQLTRGVGTAGDIYEREADAVADAVVAGQMTQSSLVPLESFHAKVKHDISPSRKAAGAVVQCLGVGKKVSYETDEAIPVLDERKRLSDYTVSGNWATIFCTDKKIPFTARSDKDKKIHAEMECKRRAEIQGFGDDQMKYLFTERSPCDPCSKELPSDLPYSYITQYDPGNIENSTVIFTKLAEKWSDNNNYLNRLVEDNERSYEVTYPPPRQLLDFFRLAMDQEQLQSAEVKGSTVNRENQKAFHQAVVFNDSKTKKLKTETHGTTNTNRNNTAYLSGEDLDIPEAMTGNQLPPMKWKYLLKNPVKRFNLDVPREEDLDIPEVITGNQLSSMTLTDLLKNPVKRFNLDMPREEDLDIPEVKTGNQRPSMALTDLLAGFSRSDKTKQKKRGGRGKGLSPAWKSP